jgi:hypothetical protein
MGLGRSFAGLQSGNIRSYAGWLAGGAAAIIAADVLRFRHALDDF